MAKGKGLLHKGTAGALRWQVYENRTEMGEAAAVAAASAMKAAIGDKGFVNVIFASAPSQNDLIAALLTHQDLDWSRVNAFHMDEYIGLPDDAPQKFSTYLQERLFSKVSPGNVFFIDGKNDPICECQRYTQLLREYPVDVCCLGIGENGHIAFNDPHVADFRDPELIKIVEIDEVSRAQQVHDGNFTRVEDVPAVAMTLTIPALVNAQHIIATVPGPTKAQAVYRTITGPLSTECPATILRRHPSAALFLDPQSAALLPRTGA